MRTYTIQVTEEQLATISMACEITARLGICQIDMAFDELPFIEPMDWSEYHAMMDDIRRKLRVHCDANMGIRRAKERHKEAWDLHAVFRHRLSWDRLKDQGKDKPDFHGVNYDEPHKTSEQPLAKIERNQDSPDPTHETLESAQAKAEAMAESEPGCAFEILRCVGYSSTSKASTFWMDGEEPPEKPRYRMLDDGDVFQGGDQWQPFPDHEGEWIEVPSFSFGEIYYKSVYPSPHRRPL